ncbi:MAG: hypothetical protein OQK75_02085 [Gammaproteobacteria bacterium]|nr:hypothetical protein [Gammaproteobacteria bacterium]MCW8986437.1 hypothetical protein [Gammaproteobacteria bacterium]MCW9030591.1 hypothetical protein [Gammaproteobacteria bacterium]
MNKRILKNGFRLIFIACLSLGLSACAGGLPKYWPEKTSRVYDVSTNQPIQDVLVVATWHGTGGLEGARNDCYHLESARTNEKGEFTISEYSEGFSDALKTQKYIHLSFYKLNYKLNENLISNSYIQNDNYYLEKFTGSPKERFAYITGRGRGPSCSSGGDSKRKSFDFHKAVYEEAKSLAKTIKEKEDVQWLKERMASQIDTSYRKFTGDEKERKVDKIIKEYELRGK